MMWLRRALPWLFLLAIAANCFELASLSVLGWNGEVTSGPRMPASIAASAADSPETLIANNFRHPVPGRPYVVVTKRSGQSVRSTVIPTKGPIGWDQALRLVGAFWVLAFASLIFVKGAKTKENALLVVSLVLLALSSPIARTVFPDVRVAFVYRMVGELAGYAMCVLLAIFSLSYGTVGRSRRALFGVALAVTVVIVIGMELQYAQFFWFALSSYGAASISKLSAASPAALLCSLLCLAAAIPSARQDERQRLGWIVAAFVPFLVGWTGLSVTRDAAWQAVENASWFFVPAGLTYAALSRKLFDIGFVLNRAAVFGGVSAIVVGAFVLLEWAIGVWFEQSGHQIGLALNAALALALGLSLRFVHHRVDRVVDTVFFRKRHEDDRSLRAFAREAAYVTDLPTLLERTRETILAHSDASSVAIHMPSGAELNDPAVLAMRASQDAVELHKYKTVLQGDYAFPMLANETVLGVLVCGAKRNGEHYAPDEIDALKTVAHGVGFALESLTRGKPIDSQFDSLHEAIARVHDAVVDIPAALARELRATPVE